MADNEKTSNSDEEPVFKISRESYNKIVNEAINVIKNGAFDVTDKACEKWANGVITSMLNFAPFDKSGENVTVRRTIIDSMRHTGAALAEVKYGSKDETEAWNKAWDRYKSYPLSSVMLDYLDNMG